MTFPCHEPSLHDTTVSSPLGLHVFPFALQHIQVSLHLALWQPDDDLCHFQLFFCGCQRICGRLFPFLDLPGLFARVLETSCLVLPKTKILNDFNSDGIESRISLWDGQLKEKVFFVAAGIFSATGDYVSWMFFQGNVWLVAPGVELF